jgi:hypothetical protein
MDGVSQTGLAIDVPVTAPAEARPSALQATDGPQGESYHWLATRMPVRVSRSAHMPR